MIRISGSEAEWASPSLKRKKVINPNRTSGLWCTDMKAWLSSRWGLVSAWGEKAKRVSKIWPRIMSK